MKMTNQVKIKELEKAILDLHGCKSKWVESIPIKETFKGETAWEGIVEVFDLKDHPTAKLAYTWSHEIEGSKKRKYYAVIQQGEINSPEKAVRASIVQDFKNRKDKQNG